MILLPLLALIAWSLALNRQGRDWLTAAMASLVIFGLTVSVGTELQSRSGMLSPLGSALVWIVCVALGLLYSRRAPPTPAARHTEPGRTRLLDALPSVLFLGLTLAVALISAPNSYDGLSYHLPRVEAWIQQGSIRTYATHDTKQVFMPSWPEYAILQFRLLSGNDRFANLVQWIAFAGAAGGAAILARALGGGRPAGLLSASLVVTLPMAVAQASGTQTDLVAACWAVTTCAFGYCLVGAPVRWGYLALSALSLGLAAATKQTALLFAALALLPALLLIWRANRRVAGTWVMVILLALAVIAGPQLARNLAVFGNVRGDRELITSVSMGTKAPSQVLVNMVRNLALHFGTPWDGVNQGIVDGVSRTSLAIGVNPNDLRTTWGTAFSPVPWTTHEEAAPNPLHLLLVIGCLLALVRPGLAAPPRTFFLVALMVGFVAFAATLKWQFYGSRLHTPLFVLALAWAAVELERLPSAARRAILWVLVLAALPAALLNYTRPLLTLPDGLISPRPSILAVPRNVHYFLYMPHLGGPYRDVALRIADSGCEDVGVSQAELLEYAIVAMARNAGSEARFRNVDVKNASARFEVKAGEPCLLLQIGRGAGKPPSWADDWHRLADYSPRLGVRGIALFAPPQ